MSFPNSPNSLPNLPVSLPIPVERVATASPYRPQRSRHPINLRLHANEGPTPPAELLQSMLQRAPHVLNRYPDTSLLQERLAARVGVDPERLLVTDGADEAIDRVCRAYLEPGRHVVLPDPGFEMIDQCATLAGARLTRFQWLHGAFPVAEVLDRMTPEVAVVAVVSPHNPTGLALTEKEFRAVAEGAGNALLMVDLAYGEFADLQLGPIALEYPNAVVLRTLSKAWGLAGLRIGYAYGSSEVIARLRAVGCPYSVSSPSAWLATEWLQTGERHMQDYVHATINRREQLSAVLRELGAQVWPSQSAFVLARLDDATGVRERLARQGISVRGYPDHDTLGDCLRISCPPDDASMQRLRAGLRQSIGGTAS